MKKQNIIFSTLFLTLITMPMNVFAVDCRFTSEEKTAILEYIQSFLYYHRPVLDAPMTYPEKYECDPTFAEQLAQWKTNCKDMGGTVEPTSEYHGFTCSSKKSSSAATATPSTTTPTPSARSATKKSTAPKTEQESVAKTAAATTTTKNICVVVMGENGEYLNNATVTEKNKPNNKAKPANYYNQHCIDIPNNSELIISADGYETKTAKASSLSDGDYGAIKLKEKKTAAKTENTQSQNVYTAKKTEPVVVNAEAKSASTPATNTAAATTITASGTVRDSEDVVIGASVVAIDSAGKNIKDKKGHTISEITDIDGHFKINVPEGARLRISYIGKKTQTIDNVKVDLNITLEEDKAVALESVNIDSKTNEGSPCFTEEKLLENLRQDRCDSLKNGKVLGYAKLDCKKIQLVSDGKNGTDPALFLFDNNQNKQEYISNNKLLTDPNALKNKDGIIKKIGGKYICVPNECIQDYEVKDGVCVLKGCSKQELKALNASEGKYEGGKCVVEKCADKYHLNNTTKQCEENKCPTPEEDWDGTKCVKTRCTPDEAKAVNAKYGKWENNQCVATDCEDEINFKLENGACVASDCPAKELEKTNAVSGHMENGKCIIGTCKDGYTPENGTCINKDILAEKQKAYEDAKATEQSDANKALTAVTTAATGIGGMQALQGMAEQSADEDAMADMAAYIETMRCTYADGKQVKAGPEEIELPGANDQELMNLRGQYLALAQDLKERKEALGMKPGIESETIMDRTQTELYDDENIGITNGNYESIYRAMMLSSEKDQAKIDDAAKTSANRVKYGAIAAGAGVVGGIVGNQLINGKSKDAKKDEAGENVKALEKEQETVLNDLKKCLKDAGVKDTDKLEFKNFYPSVLSVKNVSCKNVKMKRSLKSGETVNDIFADSMDATEIFENLAIFFDTNTISKMIGYTMKNDNDTDNAIAKIKSSVESVQKKFKEAEDKDKKSKSKGLTDKIGAALGNVDLGDIAGKADPIKK